MLRIVKYEENHSTNLAIAFKEVFDENELPYFEDFEDSGYSRMAIDRQGNVGAFILLEKTEEALGSYEVKFLGVIPRYRNKGFAKALINEVLTDVDGPIWLNVLETNVQAVRLYEHIGFIKARNFKGETGEIGVSYVINLRCYQCKKDLKSNETYIEDTPVGIQFTTYGPKTITRVVRLCWHCRTRIEP